MAMLGNGMAMSGNGMAMSYGLPAMSPGFHSVSPDLSSMPSDRYSVSPGTYQRENSYLMSAGTYQREHSYSMSPGTSQREHSPIVEPASGLEEPEWESDPGLEEKEEEEDPLKRYANINYILALASSIFLLDKQNAVNLIAGEMTENAMEYLGVGDVDNILFQTFIQSIDFNALRKGKFEYTQSPVQNFYQTVFDYFAEKIGIEDDVRILLNIFGNKLTELPGEEEKK